MAIPERIIVSKTMSCRLEEYQHLFEDIDNSCSEVNEIWSTIFEMYAVIKVGWEGLWVLSQKNCKKYNLLYPTVVIVKVKTFNPQTLTATVSVEAVQDDIYLPSLIDVPIIELHPIKNQNFNKLDLINVADWLDKCRYFFKYLWYPWDTEDNMKMTDWCAAHLKNRLQLQYDAQSGVLGDFAKNYMKLLLEESEEINEALLNIPADMSSQERRVQLVHYYLRRKVIEVELDCFEETELRHGFITIKEQERDLLNPPRKSNKGEVRLVWNSGTMDDFMKYTELARTTINNKATVKVSDSLQSTLDKSRQDDIVLVSPEEHFIKSIGNMKHGGSIKGVYPSGTVIKSDPSKLQPMILIGTYGLLTLENLTIIREEGICIQVCQNKLKIANCKIVGENSSNAKGIVVEPNCKLEVENCEFKNLATAINLQKGSSATISNTRIHDCIEGIRVGNESNLSLSKVEISSCATYGLRIESSEVESTTPVTGNIDILQNMEDFQLESVSLSDNRKGNVTLKKLGNDFTFESEDEMNESCNTIFLTDEDSVEFEDSEDITEKDSDVKVHESEYHDVKA